MTDEKFWNIVDQYEQNKTVRNAIELIVLNSSNYDEAITDYCLLTKRKASTFVKNRIFDLLYKKYFKEGLEK